MECPHLCDSVKLNRDFIKNKKCELSTLSTLHNNSSSNTNDTTTITANSSTSLSPAPSSSSSTSSSTSNNTLWKCLGKKIFLL